MVICKVVVARLAAGERRESFRIKFMNRRSVEQSLPPQEERYTSGEGGAE